jgi:hypothetical protein
MESGFPQMKEEIVNLSIEQTVNLIFPYIESRLYYSK